MLLVYHTIVTTVKHGIKKTKRRGEGRGLNILDTIAIVCEKIFKKKNFLYCTHGDLVFFQPRHYRSRNTIRYSSATYKLNSYYTF